MVVAGSVSVSCVVKVVPGLVIVTDTGAVVSFELEPPLSSANPRPTPAANATTRPRIQSTHAGTPRDGGGGGGGATRVSLATSLVTGCGPYCNSSASRRYRSAETESPLLAAAAAICRNDQISDCL